MKRPNVVIKGKKFNLAQQMNSLIQPDLPKGLGVPEEDATLFTCLLHCKTVQYHKAAHKCNTCNLILFDENILKCPHMKDQRGVHFSEIVPIIEKKSISQLSATELPHLQRFAMGFNTTIKILLELGIATD